MSANNCLTLVKKGDLFLLYESDIDDVFPIKKVDQGTDLKEILKKVNAYAYTHTVEYGLFIDDSVFEPPVEPSQEGKE